jgi:hypothetical protein
MADHRRSIFELLTIVAAWCGVGLGVWTAVYQYRQDQRLPVIEYAQYGAKFVTTDNADPRVYWRLIVSNGGEVPGRDIRVQLWDIPEDARIWCSVASKTEERTHNSLILRLPIVPQMTNVFI